MRWGHVIGGVVGILMGHPATAVIVGGTLGTGNNNDTEAGLAAHLSATSTTAFPYWNNLVRVADASGVYLGKNLSTDRGWVLSANHVTTPSNITVAGQSYSVASFTQINSSDLRLYEIGGPSDPLLPTIPACPLANIAANSGETSLMFGRGFTGNSTEPYAWTPPGTNPANSTRWGSNTVEGNALVNLGTVVDPNIQPYVYVDFDGPGDPGVTAYDAQAAIGDSGGGLFVLRSGAWQLSGIASFVDDGPDFLENPATGDDATNPSEYGDFSAYSDVFAHSAAIAAETGTLVPEPRALTLVALALGIALRRRRRCGVRGAVIH